MRFAEWFACRNARCGLHRQIVGNVAGACALCGWRLALAVVKTWSTAWMEGVRDGR